MLRVVLAVALTAALLAIAFPAVESARVQHSDQRIASELESLETVGRSLAEQNDPPPAGTTGARTEMTLRLPTKGWGSAGIDRFVIEADGTIRWAVTGGGEETRQFSGVDMRPAGQSLRLDDGRHRLVLRMHPDGSITIERADA